MNFGETVQTARGEYRCDKCFFFIVPGDRYSRWLWKVAPRRVHVMREHIDCPPDDSPEEIESVEYVPEPLLLAA